MSDLETGLGLLRVGSRRRPDEFVPLRPDEARAVVAEVDRLRSETRRMEALLKLAATNRARSAEVGSKNARRAAAALEGGRAIPRQYRDVLKVRAEDPNRSLSECALVAGMTKDAYAGRLRRGLEFAETGAVQS